MAPKIYNLVLGDCYLVVKLIPRAAGECMHRLACIYFELIPYARVWKPAEVIFEKFGWFITRSVGLWVKSRFVKMVLILIVLFNSFLVVMNRIFSINKRTKLTRSCTSWFWYNSNWFMKVGNHKNWKWPWKWTNWESFEQSWTYLYVRIYYSNG